jgi:hypothetical protein
MVRFIKFLVSGKRDCISYCVLKSKGYLNMLIQVIFMIWQNLCLVLVFSGLIFGFQLYVDMVCKYPEEITYFITRIEMYNLPFSVPLL